MDSCRWIVFVAIALIFGAAHADSPPRLDYHGVVLDLSKKSSFYDFDDHWLTATKRIDRHSGITAQGIVVATRARSMGRYAFQVSYMGGDLRVGIVPKNADHNLLKKSSVGVSGAGVGWQPGGYFHADGEIINHGLGKGLQSVIVVVDLDNKSIAYYSDAGVLVNGPFDYSALNMDSVLPAATLIGPKNSMQFDFSPQLPESLSHYMAWDSVDEHYAKARWRKYIGPNVGSSPVVSQAGNVYVASLNGLVQSYTEQGSLRWSYDTKSEIGATPTLSEDGKTLYVATYAGDIHALSEISSPPGVALRWKAQIQQPIYASFARSGKYLYAGTRQGKVVSLDAATGKIVWSYDTGAEIGGSPVGDEFGVIYLGNKQGDLFAFNPGEAPSIRLRWKRNLGGGVSTAALVSGDRLFVGTFSNKVFALDSTGTVQWETQLGGRVTSNPILNEDGNIIVSTYDDGLLSVLDSTTGIVIDELTGSGPAAYAAPTLGEEGYAYWPTMDGRLKVVDGTRRNILGYPDAYMSYKDAVILTKPREYFAFDDQAGLNYAPDEMNDHRRIALQGAASSLLQGQPPLISKGYSVEVNVPDTTHGTRGYIHAGQLCEALSGSEIVSFLFWFNGSFDSTNATLLTLTSWHWDVEGLSIIVNGQSRELEFSARASGAYPMNVLTSDVTIESNKTYMVYAAADLTRNRMYISINGEPMKVFEADLTSGTFEFAGFGGIGTRRLGDYFYGRVDEFAVYNRVLSNDDIARLYTCGTSPTGKCKVKFWDFSKWDMGQMENLRGPIGSLAEATLGAGSMASPAIHNGLVYAVSVDGFLNAINTDIVTTADSDWPMFGRNNYRDAAHQVDQVPVIESADLDVNLKGDNGQWNENTLEYRFIVEVVNSGPGVAEDVVLTLTHPYASGAEIVSLSPDSGQCDSETQCSFGSIQPKTNVNVAVVARRPNKQANLHVAQVTSSTGDPDLTNNREEKKFGGSLGWLTLLLIGVIGLIRRDSCNHQLRIS